MVEAQAGQQRHGRATAGSPDGLELVVADCGDRLAAAVSARALEGVPADSLRRLFAAAVRAHVAFREAGVELPAFLPDDGVTATEAAAAAQALLDAAGLNPFELTMWCRLGRL